MQKPIIKHDGVRRLMVKAGIKMEELRLVISPTSDNGMRTAFLAIGTNAEGRRACAIGEADAANLTPNSVAARFPTVMAAKRAIDRMALDLLGLFDLYSEVELGPNGEAGNELPSPNNGDARSSLSPPSRMPDAIATGTTSDSDGGTHPGEDAEPNGNGRGLPPSSKQLQYLRQLAERRGLTQVDATMLLNSVRTRAAASDLIERMKICA